MLEGQGVKALGMKVLVLNGSWRNDLRCQDDSQPGQGLMANGQEAAYPELRIQKDNAVWSMCMSP